MCSVHFVSSSAEGVQQDLLPLVEGTVVTTKQGVAIKTGQRALFVFTDVLHRVPLPAVLFLSFKSLVGFVVLKNVVVGGSG